MQEFTHGTKGNNIFGKKYSDSEQPSKTLSKTSSEGSKIIPFPLERDLNVKQYSVHGETTHQGNGLIHSVVPDEYDPRFALTWRDRQVYDSNNNANTTFPNNSKGEGEMDEFYKHMILRLEQAVLEQRKEMLERDRQLRDEMREREERIAKMINESLIQQKEMLSSHKELIEAKINNLQDSFNDIREDFRSLRSEHTSLKFFVLTTLATVIFGVAAILITLFMNDANQTKELFELRNHINTNK